MAEVKITVDNYEEEVLESDIPVLLDFWATWCGPCKLLSPIVAELDKKYEGKLKVGKVNVDEEPELAVAFQVVNIPLLVVMKDGKVANSIGGYRTLEQIEEMLKNC